MRSRENYIDILKLYNNINERKNILLKKQSEFVLKFVWMEFY